MSADQARQLLNKLLDRIESRPDRVLAVHERPPEIPSAADKAAFEAVLADAERAGAIEVKRHKRGEMRHLVDRISLVDASALYRFLARSPLSDIVSEAVLELRRDLPHPHEDTERCLQHLEEGWRAARSPLGLRPSDTQTGAFLRCLEAVLRRDQNDRRDLRSFSAQSLGDSKLLEENLARVLDWLAKVGRIPSDLTEGEAAAAAGLEKFQHPVLVAGTALFAGKGIAELTYVGIAPDDTGHLSAPGSLRAVLTIENFASFNRYVREALRPDEAAVYTGGFPSRAVLDVVRRLTSESAQLWHWGDVDPGGIRIADYMARKLDPKLRLHLMSPDYALKVGRRAGGIPGLGNLSGSPDVQALAAFLAAEPTAHLEQELVDPKPICSAELC
ncbi:Wadjet anti-phage system protein JetD domain-containing protein [Falsiroseomonas sp. HW251]|uniref:Wadjet anti-phage system protein JetD domain-containing protein n=1 Tax=Falsiroseomonas sp. HW251 TaxID=3390998 RepID=UPI003D321B6F